MTASLLDGKKVAALRRQELRVQLQESVNRGYSAPGLAVLLIGEDPASAIYVANKIKACAEVGIRSFSYNLPYTITQEQLITLIDELNERQDIHGILIQLPLPKHIEEQIIIERIKPSKDIDGFHPYNLGRLAQRSPLLRPCTPKGIMELLHYYHLSVKGKHAVVIGASNIVGRPMALELLLAGATITLCHRLTTSLDRLVAIADLVVVATGVIDVIDVDWLNKDQIIIDVGIHRLEDGTLRGDVDFQKAKEKVAWISPVPGGVGPMTIVTLLENTLMASGIPIT